MGTKESHKSFQCYVVVIEIPFASDLYKALSNVNLEDKENVLNVGNVIPEIFLLSARKELNFIVQFFFKRYFVVE